MGPGVLDVYGPDLPETSGGPRAILFLEFIMELSASRNLTGKSGGPLIFLVSLFPIA